MNRRTVREKVIQALYQLEFQPAEAKRIADETRQQVSPEREAFFHRLFHGVQTHQEEIDTIIEKLLKKGWRLSRIATVDRAILRLALFELLYEEETPTKVVINEAIELAKAFSGEESSRFINGCLGKWVRERNGGRRLSDKR
jgi:N utilization substance protein B